MTQLACNPAARAVLCSAQTSCTRQQGGRELALVSTGALSDCVGGCVNICVGVCVAVCVGEEIWHEEEDGVGVGDDELVRRKEVAIEAAR